MEKVCNIFDLLYFIILRKVKRYPEEKERFVKLMAGVFANESMYKVFVGDF